MNEERLRALLDNPPIEFRPQPVWSLNSVLTRERLTEMIEQFKAQGMGGVFVLPRWGLVSGFLMDEWFEMWGHAMRECKRLGIECQIYDEFVVPSGAAGGHVVATAPQTAARFLQPETHMQSTQAGDAFAAAFVLDRGHKHPRQVTGDVLRDALLNASAEQPVLTLELVTGPARVGAGGFPEPDLSRHDTTATFIRVAYEPYARRFAREFGKTVRYAYSDEPVLQQNSGGYLWSELLTREFWKDHGYRLEDRLAEFCFGGAGATAVQFDYFSTLNRLFSTNFVKQLHDWCEAHGLMYTGHFMEHNWPNPIDTPSAMALLRWMHAPGNDYLAFQFFPDDLPANRLHRFNMRELASVANQLGRSKTMAESSGAGGYSISFATFKACEDLLLAHGVNVMNPHLSHVSLAGVRQYEWPQTITDHSSWFPWYRVHADHVARVATMLSQGCEVNRVLLLQPTTSLWMHYAHPALRPGQGAVPEKLNEIAEGHYNVFFALTDRQIDFDLGDETILAELGKARARKLAVGERAYDLVVVPDVMENWTEATLCLMARYLERGGRIVQVGADAPTHVDGRTHNAPAALKAEYADQWESVAGTHELAERVAELVPPRVTAHDGSALPEGLAWRRAALLNGNAVWFFCNPWNRTLTMEVRLAGGQLMDLDTASGTMQALPARHDGGSLTMPLTLQPRGHALWLSRTKAIDDVPMAEAPWKGKKVALGKPVVTMTHLNQLMLDYCDIETGPVRLVGTTTFCADDANWRVQGFNGNPWRIGSVQFKRNWIDHEVDPDSAFRVTYRFEIAANVPAATRSSAVLAVERPWLYTVKVNGRAVSSGKARRWFDEHMRSLPVGRLLKSGKNTVELVAAQFHMLCEIKPVYILGDFSLTPAVKGFRIVATRPLAYGDWTRRGLPFYPHGVRYAWPITLNHPAAQLRLALGEWAGSVVSVLLDDREVGVILHPPYVLTVAGPIAKGHHEIAVEVIGNMRNMLGPHFNEGQALPWSWHHGPPESTAPGKAYAHQPSGLMEQPMLTFLC